MKYLEVGKIVSTHGIKGEVKVKVITDDLSRFNSNSILACKGEKDKDYKEIKVNNYRVLRDKVNMILLSFNDFTNINEVLDYINNTIYIDIDVNREEDEIYYDDLIGMDVIVDCNVIGKVFDVLEVPQGIILSIEKKNGKKSLVPYVEEFIKTVDLDKKLIIITPIEGLI